jgi:virulence-associated protein VagC
MAIAKVFRSGNSQLVRLPEELQFSSDTEEVEAHRVGDRIVRRAGAKGRVAKVLLARLRRSD